ncbi:substrate-binding domain-containing protein [Hoeflea prorocentri]|uniref:Substrate-binding domain-containing protein n=1 Tax=Hoeflea prorocentri TaxID=1922333 RepID=A0A9X3UKG6_9HYPH|nr:substrate-binding domain-containing protein [Hoeflea prorocentri]MCY6382241.1 substrate-binding domain-containing protein [Hoeflea prorocentri]MDA5400041.1 substrate-binding domain-containing protein [Hoeflea prorocentri]
MIAFRTLGAAAAALFFTITAPAVADEFILLQSTTSTQNSGLYDHLLPQFEEKTGIQVRVVAVGTGQAIKNAGNCDGDLLLVHAKQAEEAFVREGGGKARHDVMYNDFVLVGPASDPTGVRDEEKVAPALRKIAQDGAAFVSRGDDSGTHKKELSLWGRTGVDPAASSGAWYRETGSGMGATLNVAIGMEAYVLTDRATWISFGNRAGHDILLEGDPALFNQYGVVTIDPAHCPNIKQKSSQLFVDWLLGPDGQAAIAGFRLEGEQLFHPNAKNGDS